MSYPKSLDEYDTDDLLTEVDRRVLSMVEDDCPYCNLPLETHQCKMRGRLKSYHDTVAVRQWVDETNKAMESLFYEQQS